MSCRRQLLTLLGALAIAGVAPGLHVTPRPVVAQTAVSPAASRATVVLPQDDAELSIQGTLVAGSGSTRDVEIAPLAPGTTQRRTFSVTWKPNGYTTMTRSKVVTVRAGERIKVDLATEDAADRVRVIYVPTPEDVAEEMVKLAGVTSRDVVYEPGCGDARITIAALRAGARRGICIDIDKERADESRRNVQAAGLDKQIDVRLGDALDVKDLKDVTVVLLYMGDHFNMLIRPVLWRQLPVGARIVSHRFEMGDWKPDRTVNVSSDQGGEWPLHLWTITEELKRRAR